MDKIYTCIGVLICVVTPGAATEYVTPIITLLSCTHETASLRIDNATSGGILYIRTDTAYNIIPTTDGTIFYTCAFEICNIKWDEKFHVVVQRRILYQTGYDKIQWSVCNSDFGSISPINIDSVIMEEDNMTVVLHRPEQVLMRFFDNNTEYLGGSMVKLGHRLNMRLEVPNNEDGVFDITPKACWASTINLIEDRCPVDSDLFSSFSRLSAGNISNTFYMFRPTTTMGGVYDVTFTCLLEVCMYNCEQAACDAMEDTNTTSQHGTSRRKRVAEKEADDYVRRPSMVLGATLRSIADGEEILDETEEETSSDLCVGDEYLFISLVAFLLVLITECTLTGFNFYKYHLCQKEISRSKSLRDDSVEMKTQKRRKSSITIILERLRDFSKLAKTVNQSSEQAVIKTHTTDTLDKNTDEGGTRDKEAKSKRGSDIMLGRRLSLRRVSRELRRKSLPTYRSFGLDVRKNLLKSASV